MDTPGVTTDPETTDLVFTKYVRKPFDVMGVEITRENIEQAAKLIGEVHALDTDEPYIQIDRNIIPNLYKAHVGFFLTKMGKNIRCFSPKIFEEQFEAVQD